MPQLEVRPRFNRRQRTLAILSITAATMALAMAGCVGQSASEGCTFNDVTYAEGEAFDAPDGCNQCVCGGGGAITCTEVDACRVPPPRDAGPNAPEPEPAAEPAVEPGAEPTPEPAPDATPEPTPTPDPVDAGAEDAGSTDAGAPDADAGVDAGPADGGAPIVDAGPPGPPTCTIPTVGVDGCACGYLDRPASVGGEDATFASACTERPLCESSCCPMGQRPSTLDNTRCIPDDNIPPTIEVAATSFAGTGPTWGFEIRAASYGADRCRVTGAAGDRSYDFVAGAFPSVTFTSASIRYDLSEINLTFLCDNAFGLAVDRFTLDKATDRFAVSPTSEGSPFRGLVCLSDLFDGVCQLTICGGEAVVDEGVPLGGTCSGGYVATLDLPQGPSCAPVDALVLTGAQELLATCEGPDGFEHAFKSTMATALANAP